MPDTLNPSTVALFDGFSLSLRKRFNVLLSRHYLNRNLLLPG